MKKSNFTLIELISVILIISILAAIGLVSLQDLTKGANQSALSANMRNLQTAVDAYYLENEEYPTLTQPTIDNPVQLNIESLLNGYIKKEPKGNDTYWVDLNGMVFESKIKETAEYPLENLRISRTLDFTEGENRFKFTLNAPVDYEDVKLKMSGNHRYKISFGWIEDSNGEVITGNISYGENVADDHYGYYPSKAEFPLGDLSAGTHEFTFVVTYSAVTEFEDDRIDVDYSDVDFEYEFITDGSLVYTAVNPEENHPMLKLKPFIAFNPSIYNKHTISLNVPDTFNTSTDYNTEVDIMNLTIPNNAINPILYIEHEEFEYAYISGFYIYNPEGKKEYINYYSYYYYHVGSFNNGLINSMRSDIPVGYLRGKTTILGSNQYSRIGGSSVSGVKFLNAKLIYYTPK